MESWQSRFFPDNQAPVLKPLVRLQSEALHFRREERAVHGVPAAQAADSPVVEDLQVAVELRVDGKTGIKQ